MEYAVRGPLVIRATEIEKELQKVSHAIFFEVRNLISAFAFVFLRQNATQQELRNTEEFLDNIFATSGLISFKFGIHI